MFWSEFGQDRVGKKGQMKRVIHFRVDKKSWKKKFDNSGKNIFGWREVIKIKQPLV